MEWGRGWNNFQRTGSVAFTVGLWFWSRSWHIWVQAQALSLALGGNASESLSSSVSGRAEQPKPHKGELSEPHMYFLLDPARLLGVYMEELLHSVRTAMPVLLTAAFFCY